MVLSPTECAKRYVITNPPFDFGLLPTDQVSMLWVMSVRLFVKNATTATQNTAQCASWGVVCAIFLYQS